jgi:hypothetical protein
VEYAHCGGGEGVGRVEGLQGWLVEVFFWEGREGELQGQE